MGLDFCDSEPFESLLIARLTIDNICLFLQLTLITFSVYHYSSTNSNSAQRQLSKLSLFCQFIAFILIVIETFLADLEPLVFEISGKTAFYCQIVYWGLISLLMMSYIISLIVFWAWRLQMGFAGTVWEVSKTLVKVRSKKNTRASMCINILLVEASVREPLSLSTGMCVCRFAFSSLFFEQFLVFIGQLKVLCPHIFPGHPPPFSELPAHGVSIPTTSWHILAGVRPYV